MKTTRKILALLMALTLCLALAAPAFAQSTPSYTITIDNAVDGETYTAYKIFNVSYTNDASPVTTPEPENDIPGDPDPNSAHTAYAYTISDDSPWWAVVTANNGVSQVPAEVGLGTNFTANGLKFTKTANAKEWIVEEATGFNAATFAELLRDNMPDPEPTAAASVTADAGDNEAEPPVAGNMTNTTTHGDYYTTGSITLNVSSTGAGYYFVDTSMGSLCSLDTTEPTATIREKNSLPTQVKTVSDFEYGTYGASTSASIGDTVYFKIEVTDGIGTDGELIVHDVMSSGLTLDPESIVIEAEKYVLNSKTGRYDYQFMVVDSTNYTIKLKQDLIAEGDNTTQSPSDNCTFEIVFNADFIAGLGDSRHIRITYKATVNENAVIAGTGNPNTSEVEYSNQMTPESTAIVYTYAGALIKYNAATNRLSGATFAVTVEPQNTQDPGSEPVVPENTPDADEEEDPDTIGGNPAKRGVLNGATSQPVRLTLVSAGSATTPAVYRYDPNGTSNLITTPASGAVVLLGFAEGTVLTFTETIAPTGYNLLAGPVTLTIDETHAVLASNVNLGLTTTGQTPVFVAGTDDTNNVTYQVASTSILGVENNTGSELPSTGGIGTTIFIIAGSILVLGAGIILVAMSVSKRRSEEN